MSTQINVTVDRGGLVQRNRQQTTANRQARLEADGTAAAAAEGKAQRDASQSAAGSNPNGNLRSNGKITGRVKEEPAAFRNTKQSIYFGPKYEPYIQLDPAYYGPVSSYNYYFIVNTTKVKNVANTSLGFIEGCTYLEGNEFVNTGSGEVNRSSFEPGAGPNGANALKLLSTRSFGLMVVADGTVPPAIAGDKAYIYGSALTFECFVKTDFGLDSDYAGLEIWLEDFQIRIDNNDSSYFRVYPSTGGPGITHAINVNALALTSWTHLAVVLIGGAYRLYLDGVLIGEFNSVDPYASFEIRRLYLSTASLNSNRTDILWLSSLLLSSKARYGGTTFTPPTSIS